MGTPFLTIEKGFRVDTRNLLFRPKGFRKNRKYPLVTALHGMGMTAEEFASVFEPLRELPILLFVPEGVYPFEIRTGGQMRVGRAWYLYTGDEEEFVRSMTRSGRHLRTLVDKVIAEYPVDPARRVLLGFSQGGYFAGYLGIRDYTRITGLVVMGARIKTEVLEKELARARDLDVLLIHGRKDRAVPLRAATAGLEALAAAGLSVDLKTYDCGHHITAEQVRDVRDWLEDLFF